MTYPNLFGLFFRKSIFFQAKAVIYVTIPILGVYFARMGKEEDMRILSKIGQNFRSSKKRQFSHINILEYKENRPKNVRFSHINIICGYYITILYGLEE